MEMSEKAIKHRISANLTKTPLHQLKEIGKEKFINRLDNIRQKGTGSFKVIQFPTTAHSGNFRAAINELKMKQNWMPDIVVVDYIGICSSSILSASSTIQSYILKSISEELRNMAVELDVVVWSAQQITREGMKKNDHELTDIADSLGIARTIDFTVALTRSEKLDAIGQVECKQLKNRYREHSEKKKFVLGCEFNQQLLYDVSVSDSPKPKDEPKIPDSKSIQEKFERHHSKKNRDFSGVDTEVNE